MRQEQTITVYVPKKGRAPKKHGISMNKLLRKKYQEYKANAGSDNKQVVPKVADNIPQENS